MDQRKAVNLNKDEIPRMMNMYKIYSSDAYIKKQTKDPKTKKYLEKKEYKDDKKEIA